MENQTSKLIELLVNNKKKKRIIDDNINLRDKLFEILEILIDRETHTTVTHHYHHYQDLTRLLVEFCNLYIIISINIRLYHFDNIESDIHYILNNIIDNVFDKINTINNNEGLTKVMNLVKEKKEKLEFINVDKIT